MDESQVTFAGPDGGKKGWILFHSDVPVTKRKQQGGHSMIIWVEIVGQTMTRQFKVDEGVNLNSAKILQFYGEDFLCMVKVYRIHTCLFFVKLAKKM